jgi:hypothetical protein
MTDTWPLAAESGSEGWEIAVLEQTGSQFS